MTDMTHAIDYINLRNTLAELYWEKADARRITTEAGLNPTLVAFSDIAVVTWSGIIEQANAQNLLTPLIKKAIGEFPKIEILKVALDILEAGGKIIEPNNAETPRIDNELTQPHRFDLRDSTEKLREVFDNKETGLIGVAVDCEEDKFFNHFHQRLLSLLNNPSMPEEDMPLGISTGTHRIDIAVNQVMNACCHKSGIGDLVIPVQTTAPATASLAFWKYLCTKKELCKLDYRLVVSLRLKDEECQTDDKDLVPLGQPICMVGEAYDWLDLVWQSIGFTDKETKKNWRDVICCECRLDKTQIIDKNLMLDVAQMYKHMRDMMRILNENPTQEILKVKLLERKKIYE